MVVNLTVRSLGLEGTRFAWEVDLAHDDVLPLIQFYVEAGEGRDGPWFAVNDEPVVGAFGLVSKKKFQGSMTERTNYRIRAVNLKKAGAVSFSDVVPCHLSQASKRAMHIARQERRLLRRMNTKCLHYARMHFGPRCDCYDAGLGKRIVHSCAKCHNTTFVGGYYYPAMIHITMGAIGKTGEPSQFGVQENAMVDAWTSNDVIIEVGDLLVMARNPGERYVVRQAQATSMVGVTIRQSLNLQRVAGDAPEMTVPVVEMAEAESDDVFRRYWGAH